MRNIDPLNGNNPPDSTSSLCEPSTVITWAQEHCNSSDHNDSASATRIGSSGICSLYTQGSCNVSRFLNDFNLKAQINLTSNASDLTCLSLFLSYLDGAALIWAKTYIDKEISNNGSDWISKPRLFNDFLSEFSNIFGDTIKPAPSRIYTSQQEGESARDYLERVTYHIGSIDQRNLKLVDSYVTGLLPSTYAAYKKSYIDVADYKENANEVAKIADNISHLQEMYRVWKNRYNINREEWVDMDD